MSRSEAERTFFAAEYERAMDGIFTTLVGQSTLGECPMAYKPAEAIIENIGDTAGILDVIRPIYNFKAGE